MTAKRIPSHFNSARFAPSTTGRVHPGTLLAGLLCWLDARASGAEITLRLEDLDHERSKAGFVEEMERDLAWFGLEWDSRSLQSENREGHDVAMERLVEAGRVYTCDCSRSDMRASGESTPDGGARYAGTCRAKIVSGGSWRDMSQRLRLQLPAREIQFLDESGLQLAGDPSRLYGDPILRRRDGAYAYHFASVVDDAAGHVDRIVRGRDLAPSTLMQIALQTQMEFSTPSYRHHVLLLERAASKLSKSHGAIGLDVLREKYSAAELCGLLASFVDLVPPGTRCRPQDLVDDFDWCRVRDLDVELQWEAKVGLSPVS